MTPALPAGSVIFLIGYRGTGKSAVAQRLAERLGWSWLDADVVLEERWGRSIRQMFAEDGEPVFREREAALLVELCRYQHHVIATGGGVILRADNRQRMKQAGPVVLLSADVETIWQRLQADAATRERRPDLTVGGRAEIEELLRVRRPLYETCADCVVNTTHRSPDEVVDAILEQWQEKHSHG
jgi:shikimate kinase